MATIFAVVVLLTCSALLSSAAGRNGSMLVSTNQSDNFGATMGDTTLSKDLVNGSNRGQQFKHIIREVLRHDTDSENAGYTTKSYVGHYGFMATMDVYGFPLSPGQMFSYASVWIITDDADGTTDNLEGLHIGWSDTSSGNWLVYYGFNRDEPELIGRIPMSFFASLSSSATNIWFGGMVFANLTTEPAPPPVPMGSGYMVADGGDMAASMKNLQFMDEQGRPWPAVDDLAGYSTKEDVYAYSPIVDGRQHYGYSYDVIYYTVNKTRFLVKPHQQVLITVAVSLFSACGGAYVCKSCWKRKKQHAPPPPLPLHRARRADPTAEEEGRKHDHVGSSSGSDGDGSGTGDGNSSGTGGGVYSVSNDGFYGGSSDAASDAAAPCNIM
uniref:Neprosin PEP catalytic domain-containing protein n=1 Tax=Oryza brachyantha TaxID=4533 RepID=J3MGX8_ORYBR